MASSTRVQPPWAEPKTSAPPKLKFWNSLTRTKNDFVPIDAAGIKVTWYNCGPTVYDDAHLGHARNYITTDILRRIMSDYFGFEVNFVQNVTDVDDKIILRGRQQHLLSRFKATRQSVSPEVLSTAMRAFRRYIEKNIPFVDHTVDPGSFEKISQDRFAAVLEQQSLAGDESAQGDKTAKTRMHLQTATSAARALSAAVQEPTKVDATAFYAATEDVLLPYLDALEGASIDAKDHSIFTKLTQKYEKRFSEDMRSLNVLDPSVVTRVTEYGPQIVEFVDKIIQNEYGYVTEDGSVYFDIQGFEKTSGNHYARLEPWNRTNEDLQADGEGALTKKSAEKRSDADFALWKSSKPGEPSWPSPWGPGRPGWHIECSAMASDVLGKQIDIHSGGIDLCFPHHDNEAHWAGPAGGHQWVNYFLHTGHLSIAGSKMSKSLKNFTTIREALARDDWTARSLRIIFLLGGWHDGVEITDSLRKAGAAFESYVTHFFFKVRDVEAHPNFSKANAEDEKLRRALESARDSTHAALANSFDTPAAMRSISTLITEFNTANRMAVADDTVFDLARWITRMVRVFGLDGSTRPDDDSIGWEGTSIPAEAKPFIYAVARERHEVRTHSIAGTLSEAGVAAIVAQDDGLAAPAAPPAPVAAPFAAVLSSFQTDVQALAAAHAPSRDYLALCDRVRDVQLWDLGIYLEDRGAAPALARPLDPELRAARAHKEQLDQQKREARLKRERDEKDKAAQRAAQAKMDPTAMFRSAEFSAWDDDGVPTKDRDGNDVPKSRVKKLRKEWEKQRKLHDEWKQQAGQ